VPKLPNVSGELVIRALKRADFLELRQKGNHVSLEKRIAEIIFRTVVPMHSALAKGAHSGLTLDEFLELL
jgi:predicted RNA binding protein YcfA (HicA-like mRNA interferase family)